MTLPFAETTETDAIPLTALTKAAFEPWRDKQIEAAQSWLARHGFSAAQGQSVAIPNANGEIGQVVLGLGERSDLAAALGLPEALQGRGGIYRLSDDSEGDPATIALGWALGNYSFERYKRSQRGDRPRLCWPAGVDRAAVTAQAEADRLVRDLVNTPANDMGPDGLAAAARELAHELGASCREILGDALLDGNYPLVHAVGRASAEPPRLIDIRWGHDDAPRLTLVGKGVCFDSGGLGIKPASGMELMKKDMGGAAHILGLARLIIAHGLPVRLRVLLPIVENAIAGNAFRPRDVLSSRKGLSVEIGHTDAEGRLILADALTEADSEEPDLLIDMATLTGAARAALGPALAPYYTASETLAEALEAAAEETADPVWRLPLWRGYQTDLDSPVADVHSTGRSGFAGSIMAALFLKRFIAPQRNWLHFDIYAWNPANKPGRPIGAATQGIRALFAMLKARYDG